MILFIKSPNKNWLQRLIIGFWVLITIWVTFSNRLQAEFEYLLDNTDVQSKNFEFKTKIEGGNKLATYGSAIMFAPVMFIAPFPTFVNIDTQQYQMMFSGGFFVKNILGFFVLISIVVFIRRRNIRKYILIVSFLFSYLAILAQSSFALSDRFHLPSLPFVIILAAYGITQINIKNKTFFVPYLVLIIVMIVAWNAFKLAGRGML